MSMQPFRGSQRVILERRFPDGSLDLKGQWPPDVTDFDSVYRLYFRAVPDGTGTWENLSTWLAERGWSIRAKTW